MSINMGDPRVDTVASMLDLSVNYLKNATTLERSLIIERLWQADIDISKIPENIIDAYKSGKMNLLGLKRWMVQILVNYFHNLDLQ